MGRKAHGQKGMASLNILWILSMGAAALALQAALFGLWGLKKVRYERKFTRSELFAGETNEMVETIENRKWLPVPWLRVESRMPESFRFGRQQNLSVDGSRYHRSMFFLSPYRRIIRRHAVRCDARGVFDLSSVVISSGDLFGLKAKSSEGDMRLSVTVYPRLLNPDELILPSSRWQGELIVKRWIVPDPFLYSGIREYRAGDPLRDVHWRASARTGKLQVMQRDFTASPRLMILINVQVAERQWNKLNEGEAALIERAISLAATAALHAIANGVEAGIGCNGAMTDGAQGETLCILPAASPQQRQILLNALAHIKTERQLSFHTYLDALPGMTGMDFLIITPYISPMLEQRADLLRARGNTALFLPVDGGGEADALGA